MTKKTNRSENRQNRMPGEFDQKYIEIGLDCRQSLQHYYAIGGNQLAFATFKGIVTEISETKGYLFTKLYVQFDDDGWDWCNAIETSEDHVWVYDAESFKGAGIKVGDSVQFTALAYAYHRRDGSEDYALKAPQDIKKINPYDLPKEPEGISDEQLGRLVCEACIYDEHCYREPCIAAPGWREGMIAELRRMLSHDEEMVI